MPKRTAVSGHDTRQHATPRNYCFACGKDNPDGMHLKFFYHRESKKFIGRFRLAKRFQGPPGHAHGGIIATVLDEAMGKVNKLRSVIALTSGMKVQYVKPVPLRQPLVVESHEVRVRGRRHINAATILDGRGQVLARGRATFIAIDPVKMFAKYVKDRKS